MGIDFITVMNNINDCFVIYDSETNGIIYCNNKFCETFGYAQEELSHISFESMITDESKNYFKKVEKLSKEAKNSKPQLFKCSFRSKYNRPLYLEVYLKTIQHECERLLLAVMHEVNKYKQEEEKRLCESEKKYQTLIENIPIHISACDSLYKIVLWNNYAEKLLGYKAEEIVGRAFAQVLHESKEDADDVVRTSIEKGVYDKEINFVHKCGELVPVHLVVVPWKDIRNRIIGFFGFAEDITECKEAQENLRKSEELYRSLVENIDMGIALIDKNCNIIMGNAALSKLFNIRIKDLIGKKCYQLIRKSNKKCPSCLINKFLLSKGAKEMEIEGIRHDGSHFPIHLREFSISEGRDRSAGFIILVEDITERKEAEKKFRNYQEQLRCLASALSLSEERERRRIATELHDCVGHALGISKIKLESIQESKIRPHIRKSIDEIHSIINKMITDTRSLTFELSPPILYELGLEATLEWLIEDIYKRHGISGVVVDDKRPKPLDKDVRVILFQSVRELLVNVVKHSNASNIRVSITRNNGNIVINVEDDGIGFKKRKNNSNLKKNLCFGFFSIQERLNHIGGSFEIKSEPDKGTCIRLVAPLSRKT